MKLILTAAAFAALAIPSYALTLEQAQNELAGMSCSGSTCTSSTPGTRTEDNPDIVVTVDNPDIVTSVKNPDIVTTTDVLVSPATSDAAPNTSLQSFGHCPPMRTMNGGWTARTNVNADCTALSIVPGSGGRSAVYGKVTTVTDGGTTDVITDGGTTTTVTDGGVTIIDTCTVTSKTLSYNGPNTDRAGAWSVSTSVDSSDGGC